MKILIISTPVGPLGSGIGGGVELTVSSIANLLHKNGHKVLVIAPKGSLLDAAPLVEIEGQFQPYMQKSSNAPLLIPENSVLENMWEYAQSHQNEYDVLLNLGYDWLPFYLTPFFHRPIAHWLTMCSLTKTMDTIVNKTIQKYPGTIGVFTHAQADTFPFCSQLRVLGNGIDLTPYQYCAKPDNYLAWFGRISPEKGVEDAIQASILSKRHLKIMGIIQDEAYWKKILENHPEAYIDYLGFLNTQELQKIVRKAQAVFVTPKWIEAFGNVAIEAMACGTPVIAYKRGGLVESVVEGKTGFLVEKMNPEALAKAVSHLDQIQRIDCRKHVEKNFSLDSLLDETLKWLQDICQHQR